MRTGPAMTKKAAPGRLSSFMHQGAGTGAQYTPWASIASATFTKAAMFAPST